MFRSNLHPITEPIVRLWLFFSLAGCGIENRCLSCGIVLMRTQVNDPNAGGFADAEGYFPTLKIWFRDSVVIQQIKSVYFEKVNNITTKREARLLGFTFIHLPSRTFFLYKTFSDTAKPVTRWTEADSATMSVYGGWRFYNPYFTPRTGSPAFLRDTVCDGVLYKRAKFNDIQQGIKGERTFYYRCDKKGTMFRFDQELSDSLGCPITIIESESKSSNLSLMRTKIDFVSDCLSDDELRVFAAWEMNAKKKNPAAFQI